MNFLFKYDIFLLYFTVNNDISLIKLKTPVTCKAKKIEVACITTNEPSEGQEVSKGNCGVFNL